MGQGLKPNMPSPSDVLPDEEITLMEEELDKITNTELN
jgi:hypothetical protein